MLSKAEGGDTLLLQKGGEHSIPRVRRLRRTCCLLLLLLFICFLACLYIYVDLKNEKGLLDGPAHYTPRRRRRRPPLSRLGKSDSVVSEAETTNLSASGLFHIAGNMKVGSLVDRVELAQKHVSNDKDLTNVGRHVEAAVELRAHTHARGILVFVPSCVWCV